MKLIKNCNNCKHCIKSKIKLFYFYSCQFLIDNKYKSRPLTQEELGEVWQNGTRQYCNYFIMATPLELLNRRLQWGLKCQ